MNCPHMLWLLLLLHRRQVLPRAPSPEHSRIFGSRQVMVVFVVVEVVDFRKLCVPVAD